MMMGKTARPTTTIWVLLVFRIVAASLFLVLPSVVSSLAPQRNGPPAAARSPLFPQRNNLAGSMGGAASVGSAADSQHVPTARIRGPQLFASQNNNNNKSWTSSSLTSASQTTTTTTTTQQPTSSCSNSSRRKRQRRGFWAAARTALASASVSSGTLGVALPRGGTKSTTALLGPAQWLLQRAVSTFAKFSNFMGASKTRCLLMLFCSILLECYATTLSKRAKDTGQVLVFVHACSLYLMCMVGFNISLAKLDVSIAYAVWGAIGTVLVTAVGFLFFGETLDMVKILCLTLIVVGVAGLNLRG